VGKDLVRIVVGSPLASLNQIPSTIGLVAVAICGVAGVVAGLRSWRGAVPAGLGIEFGSPWLLMIVLAAATPVGVLLYSLVATDIWLPRGLSGSIPAIAIVLAAALAALPRRLPAAAAIVVLATLVFGTVRSFGSDYVRQDYRAMASYLDRVAGPRDPILLVSLIGAPAIEAQATRPHDYVRYTPTVWSHIPAAPRLYIVYGDEEMRDLETGIPRPRGFRLLRDIHYHGTQPTELLVYVRS
jgi:hypothetical protein